LGQKSDWQHNDPAKPDNKTLRQLARLYLAKAPGMTAMDVNKFLPEDGNAEGIPRDDKRIKPDSDERVLYAGQVNDDTLQWYIGKKSIGRLGCYACHDVPGFEAAKPI